MEFNGWNSFEDLARACGYTNCNKDRNNGSETNESCNMSCNDIPNGFQTLSPELFIVIGEILGNMLAGSIPSNVQNSLGNWLELVGQAILTYNAQQQYFEQGPARYFNPKNYNVDNSSCTTTTQNTSNTNNSSKERKGSSKSKEKDSNCDYDRKSQFENKVDKMEELELRINQLNAELEKIKNKMGN